MKRPEKIYLILLCLALSSAACGPERPAAEQAISPAPSKADERCIPMAEVSWQSNGDQRIAYVDGEILEAWLCSYYPNQQVHTRYYYSEGKPRGEWEVYYPSGTLYKTGSTIEGKDHGDYFEYFQSGQLRYHYFYREGKRNGLWKSWYENGQKYTERQFSNGKLHGKVRVWDEEGNLTKEYTYSEGKLLQSNQYQ